MYKKIFRTTNIRIIILNLFSFVPDKIMLKIQYYIYFNRKLNLEKPKRFTEKIQKYKLTYKNENLPKFVDKYEVRKTLTSYGFEDYFPKLYLVIDSLENVSIEQWNQLPKTFIVKESNGSGGHNVVPVFNKNTSSIDSIKGSFITKNTNFVKHPGREWPYEKIKNKFIFEELLVDPLEEKGLRDYKFFCFNGEPKYVVLDANRFIDHKRNIYDINWKNLNITSDKLQLDTDIKKPKNFDEMINLSKKLSKEFPFVRIDLYNIDGKIYIGELTFYPWSGYVKFNPDSFDYELGRHFEI